MRILPLHMIYTSSIIFCSDKQLNGDGSSLTMEDKTVWGITSPTSYSNSDNKTSPDDNAAKNGGNVEQVSSGAEDNGGGDKGVRRGRPATPTTSKHDNT